MKKYSSFIFDMDGTLVHNMHYHKEAWLKFLSSRGYQMTEEELASYNQSLAGSEQVTCIQLQTDPNQASRRFCGTLEEIERRLELKRRVSHRILQHPFLTFRNRAAPIRH